MNQGKNLLGYWPLFFLLGCLEATAIFVWLALIPTGNSGLILGYSTSRLALLGFMLGIGLACGYLAFRSRTKTFRSLYLDPNLHPFYYQILSMALPLIATGAGIGAFLLRWYDPDRTLSLFVRAWPVLLFILVFSIQTAVWILFLQRDFHPKALREIKRALIPTLFVFVILLTIAILIAITKLGLTPDNAYWGEPGVPILAWQFGLALITSVLFFLFATGRETSRLQETLIPIAIWLLAVIVWLRVPIETQKNSFYLPITPPTNLPLPYSDSGYYDYMAHSLLIGTDYTGEIPTRPLYIVFLAALHLVFGERYDLIITGQTFVLALIPVILYFIGKKLHSRTAGVTVALLAIFRELTNLLVASETRVSNTATLLVDLPTLLLILLACLLTMRWLERKDSKSAFLAGGTFGILLLLRTQSMLILPFLLLLAFLALRAESRPWLTPLVVFSAGIAVSVMPWLTHNYLRIGSFSFDAPFQYQVIASQYAYIGNLDYASIDMEGKGVGQILLTFALKDPAFVAGFIANHFLATQIGAILALPLTAPFTGLRAPIEIHWFQPEQMFTPANLVLIFVYLLFIAFGIGASWRRWRWAGLLPLGFNLGYALANGVGRFSGWRYDLPADWIAYFYFGIGFVELLIWTARSFGENIQPSSPGNSKPVKKATLSWWLLTAFSFAFIGAVPWIAENLSAARYPQTEPSALQVEMTNLSPNRSTEISAFTTQPEAVTLQGRLLYPRYFTRGNGLMSTTPWQSYAIRDYPRLGFLLLNHDVTEIVLPIKEPTFGQLQGQDVLLLGCRRDGYVEARLVDLPDENTTYMSSFEFAPCTQ